MQNIVNLAAEISGGTEAMISFLDKDYQHILVGSTLNKQHTPLHSSFCIHCVNHEGPLAVSDATADHRFANNKFVRNFPFIRSYVGIPLSTPGGVLLGVLCSISSKKNSFTARTIELLTPLAEAAEAFLALLESNSELQRLNLELEDEARKLNRTEAVFRQAEKVGGIGIWQVDLDTSELIWSEQVYKIHGRIPGERVTVSDAADHYIEGDREMVLNAVNRATRFGETFEFEASIRRQDGSVRRVRSKGERVEFDGQPDRVIGIFYDVTESYETFQDLKFAASHDGLTGLRNRQAFDAELANRIRSHDPWKGDFHVILIDLDGFKDVNDFFGHLVGDVVLQQAASRLENVIGPNDLAARWGGDEFVVVSQQGLSTDEARQFAERIIAAISTRIEVSGNNVSVGASCGLSMYREGLSGKELLRRADLALYHGKAREPGRAHSYRPEFESAMAYRQNAVDSVRSAIDEGRIFAGYQSIVELRTGEIVGMESLLRLREPNGKVVAASQVLPALLDPTLSRRVFETMFAAVCSDFHRLSAALPHLQFLSINATEADLLCRDFLAKFTQTLETYSVPPQSISLEVTETLLMVNDTQYIRGVLNELKRLGVSIALDDFGTGFSSLAHLRDFPIDKVKIDKSFVNNLTLKQSQLGIVQALVAMGQNLSLDIVAEGIETDTERAMLQHLGCKLGQGYLFSKALSLEEIELLAGRPIGRRLIA